MAFPILVTCLITLFFFIGGCVQIGIYIAQVPTEPFQPFFAGLVITSWPLAVASALIILLDIRMNQTGSRNTEAGEPDFPEERTPRRVRTAQPAAEANKSFSYFGADASTVPLSTSSSGMSPTPQPAQQVEASPFATPPPFQQQQPEPAPAAEKKAAAADDSSDLSFFKL